MPYRNYRGPGRRSIRLRGYDYAKEGMYFVTICSFQNRQSFGEIINGVMVLSDFGKIVLAEWDVLPERWPHLELGVRQVMPNHFHAILVVHRPVGMVLVAHGATAKVAPTIAPSITMPGITVHGRNSGASGIDMRETMPLEGDRPVEATCKKCTAYQVRATLAVATLDAHESDVSMATAHESDVSMATAHESDVSMATAHGSDVHIATAHGSDVHMATAHGSDVHIATAHGSDVHIATAHGSDVHIATAHGSDVSMATAKVAPTIAPSIIMPGITVHGRNSGASGIDMRETMPLEGDRPVEATCKKCPAYQVRATLTVALPLALPAENSFLAVPFSVPSFPNNQIDPSQIQIIPFSKSQWATRPTLGQIIGAYKSKSETECLKWFKQNHPGERMGKIWQRSFFDSIIRDRLAYKNITWYIINNPKNWPKYDLFNK